MISTVGGDRFCNLLMTYLPLLIAMIYSLAEMDFFLHRHIDLTSRFKTSFQVVLHELFLLSTPTKEREWFVFVRQLIFNIRFSLKLFTILLSEE